MGAATVELVARGDSAAPAADWPDVAPRARFHLDFEGTVAATNRLADEMLATGWLKVAAGRLRFGSEASDRAILAALHRARHSAPWHQRVVVRQMDGEWAAADLYRSSSEPSVLLVMQARRQVPPAAMAALSAAFDLTRSESSVLHLLTLGDCPKQIARDLDISEHTVRSHLRSIYSKLGVRGVANVLRLALRLLC